MMSFLSQLFRRASRTATRDRRARLALEALESRWVPSTLYVTTPSDTSPHTGVSLRDAITQANHANTPTTIDFQIPGTGVQTILLQSPLPALTDPYLTIDGTSQPGYSTQPLIVLNGSSAGSGANGLTVGASNCTIQGLDITGFSGNGVDVENTVNLYLTISGNIISNNSGPGVYLYNSTQVTLTGNTISNNGRQGIYLNGSSYIYIGCTANSTTVPGNTITSNGYHSSNGIPYGGIGIDQLSGNVYVYNNDIEKNKTVGIHVGCSQVMIYLEYNTIWSNGGDGVLIDDWSPDETTTGALPRSQDVYVEFDDIEHNGAEGIHVGCSSYIYIENCKIWSNAQDGVLVDLYNEGHPVDWSSNTSNVWITSNDDIEYNGIYGVGIGQQSSNVKIAYDTINNNKSDGVNVYGGSSSIWITNDYIESNSGYGINFAAGYNVYHSGNIYWNNTKGDINPS